MSLIPAFKSTKSTATTLIAVAYAGLFFSIPVSNVTLIILLVYCLIKTPPRDLLVSFRTQPLPFLVLIAYILLVVGLLYTENLDNGFFVLEKKITLLLIPLLALPLLQRAEIPHNLLFRHIGYISLGSSVLLLGIAGYKSVFIGDTSAFYFENLTKPFIHYVYYALYFATSTLCLIDALYEEWVDKKYGIALLVGLLIYSLAFMILVASKTGILAYSVAAVFLLYRRMSNKRMFVTSLSALIVAAIVFLSVNETTRSRFTELTENLSILTRDQLGDWQEEKMTGLNMRLLFWKLSVTHIWQDGNVLWGVGTGDAQDYLDILYTDPRYDRIGYVGWDTHNEWVFTFVQVGLISVAVWAAIYLIYLRLAWRASDVKFLVFLFVTFAFSFSESILESNKGIVFFALFLTVFASSYPRIKPGPS